MAVLTYIESSNGKIKKSGFELASYACELAKQTNSSAIAITINCPDASEIANYGIDKVLKVNSDSLNEFNAKLYSDVISQALTNFDCDRIVLSSSSDSKYLAPLLAAKIDASYLNNVISLPLNLNPFTVRRTAFTNKAFSDTSSSSKNIIIGLSNNSFGAFYAGITLLGMYQNKEKKEQQNLFKSPPPSPNLIKNLIKGFGLNIINFAVLVFWILIVANYAPGFQDSQYKMIVFFLVIVGTYFTIDLGKIYLAQQLKQA